MNTPIQANDIDTIEALAPGHPVFQLYGKNNDSIVIKAEGDETKSLGQHAQVLAVVDPNALHLVLTPQERQELRRWANSVNASDTATRNALVELNKVLLFDLHFSSRKVKYGTEQGSNQKTQVIFKMQPRAGLTDLKKASSKIRNKDGTVDKTDVRLIAKALNASGGLEQLGQILVADFFNGSQDRFSAPFRDMFKKNALVTEGGAYTYYEGTTKKSKRFKIIQNHGNVFVYMDGKKARPIGLDFFDYGSAARDYSLDNTDLIESRSPWPGRWLVSGDEEAQARWLIAQNVVDDLNEVLGPRDRTFSIARTERLEKNAATRFYTGMDQGIAALKEAWEQKKLGGAKPAPGLLWRIGILGW